MEWYIRVLKKYAVFEGRATRKEYWMFHLFNLIISIGIGILSVGLKSATHKDQSILRLIYSLAVFLPSIAVAIRRMHDTGRSGWWSIVPIMGLVYAIEAGQPSENQYGPDPNGQKY